MKVNISDLDKKIKFVTTTSELDSEGTLIPKETLYYNPWAQVTNQSGSELIKSGAELSEVKTRFLIRCPKLKEITTQMSIVFNSDYYDIEYINDYNFSHDFIEIFTTVRG